MSATYDLLVIGGGSGGLACARRASKMYGAKVGLIETARLGGTCVNVGCVPKKVSYNAAWISDCLNHFSKDYKFQVGNVSDGPLSKFQLDWYQFKLARDAYVQRLNQIYFKNLQADKVDLITGFASFTDKNTLSVASNNDAAGPTTVSAKHILIASGGHAVKPDWPGVQYCLDSDGFFDLEQLPKKTAVVGAGYIAVELAGVLNALGSDVTLILRHDRPLRQFDHSIGEQLLAEMESAGVKFVKCSEVDRISFQTGNVLEQIEAAKLHKQLTSVDTVNENQINVHVRPLACAEIKETKEQLLTGFHAVIYAIGRVPNLAKLNLQSAGVEVSTENGHILTDKYQNTSQLGIYAVGDVCGPAALTPVAIAAGRKLADRLFGNQKEAHMDYTNIPSVVFSHPPIGSIGMTENEARAKYPESELKIYTTRFNNMFFCFTAPEHKQKTFYKLVCHGKEERIIGMHIIGMGSDEILQGFGVAIKMGATKADFDSCVAIHPTAAEELVTMR